MSNGDFIIKNLCQKSTFKFNKLCSGDIVYTVLNLFTDAMCSKIIL